MVPNSDSSHCFLVRPCVLLFILSPHHWKHLSFQPLIAMNCLRMLRSQSVCWHWQQIFTFIHRLLKSPRTMPLLVNTMTMTTFIQSVHFTRTITVYHKFWTFRWLGEQPSSTSRNDWIQYYGYSQAEKDNMPSLLKHPMKKLPSTIPLTFCQPASKDSFCACNSSAGM